MAAARVASPRVLTRTSTHAADVWDSSRFFATRPNLRTPLAASPVLSHNDAGPRRAPISPGAAAAPAFTLIDALDASFF